MKVDIITPIYRKQEELYNSQSDDDNIIFLDIDGVLNYVTCADRVPHSSAIFGINQYNVALLSQIVKKTNAKIVLTSSWKSGFLEIWMGARSFQRCRYNLSCNFSSFTRFVYNG